MGKPELEGRLALSLVVFEQTAKHREQFVTAPKVKGSTADLSDMSGEGSGRIARDVDELKQGAMPADLAFKRKTEQTLQRIGRNQRIPLCRAFLDPTRQDHHERLRHGGAEGGATDQPVNRVAKRLRITGAVEAADEEVVEQRALYVGRCAYHVGKNIEEGRRIKLVGVGKNIIHAAEICDPDRLAFG